MRPADAVSAPRRPRDTPGPVLRRDADGAPTVASGWEPLVERLIREAQERGSFDDLPHRGRPLVVHDDPFAGEMALAWHVLRNADAVPPWIAADREVRRHRAAIGALLGRVGAGTPASATLLGRLDTLAADHDAAVARLNAAAPADRLHRRPLGVARMRSLCAEVAAGAPVPPFLADPDGHR